MWLLLFLIFRCAPSKLFRIDQPLGRKLPELFDNGVDGLLAVNLVVAGADVDGVVRAFFLANNYMKRKILKHVDIIMMLKITVLT